VQTVKQIRIPIGKIPTVSYRADRDAFVYLTHNIYSEGSVVLAKLADIPAPYGRAPA
jgi:predicted solute-binding protein